MSKKWGCTSHFLGATRCNKVNVLSKMKWQAQAVRALAAISKLIRSPEIRTHFKAAFCFQASRCAWSVGSSVRLKTLVGSKKREGGKKERKSMTDLWSGLGCWERLAFPTNRSGCCIYAHLGLAHKCIFLAWPPRECCLLSLPRSWQQWALSGTHQFIGTSAYKCKMETLE